MHRFVFISAALACLGGCTCKGAPSQPSSTPDAGLAVQRREPPPKAEEAPPPPGPIPEQAMKLHAQGREHGEAGRFQEALKHFGQARELAPDWLLPVYDTGYTYLLMEQDARALELYEGLNARAPQGFSDSKRVLDSLRRERDGRVPKGTYRQFLRLMQLRDMEELRRGLRALTRSAPGFFPAWQELAAVTEDAAEAERLVAKALALGPDPESRGQLLVHQAHLLGRRGEHEAARKQLQALIDDPATHPNVVTLAKEALLDPAQP